MLIASCRSPITAPSGLRGLPAVFFDRDGVLNVDRGYVSDPRDLEWIPGAKEAVLRTNQAGKLAIVATNQSGIGRGLFGMADFERFMERMNADLSRNGAHLDAVYVCPDHPTECIGEFRRDCSWRKPGPGMLLQAIADWGLYVGSSVMIGDSDRDIVAAHAAGVQGLLFRGGDLAAFAEANRVW